MGFVKTVARFFAVLLMVCALAACNIKSASKAKKHMDRLKSPSRKGMARQTCLKNGVDVPIEAPTGPGPHALRRIDGQNSRQASTYRKGNVLLLGAQWKPITVPCATTSSHETSSGGSKRPA